MEEQKNLSAVYVDKEGCLRQINYANKIIGANELKHFVSEGLPMRLMCNLNVLKIIFPHMNEFQLNNYFKNFS